MERSDEAVQGTPEAPPRVLGAMSLAVFAASAAWNAIPLPWPADRFDGGIPLVAADLISAGRTPYAEFQTLYPPGTATVLAGAFALFGRSHDTAMGVDAALRTLNAWVAWHVAARLTPGGGLRAIVAACAGLSFLYAYPSLVLALASVLAAVRLPGGRPFLRAVAAGALAGLAAWFRQDVGAAACAAAAVGGVTAAAGQGRSHRIRIAAATVAASGATLLLLLSPSVLAAPREVFEGLVLRPMATVPWRSHGTWTAEDPVLLAAAAAGLLLAGWGAAAALAPRRAGAWLAPGTDMALLAGCGVLAAWGLRYLVLRPDPHHVIPLGILVGVAAALRPAPALRARLAVGITAAVAVACVGIALWRAGGARASHLLGRRTPRCEPLGDAVPGASTVHLPPGTAAEYAALIRRVRELAPGGEPFLSACLRHDRIHSQDLLLWFLAGSLPPVRDHHFDPGVTTREDVQRRIVDDAERSGVRLVVRWDVRPPEPPPESPPGSEVLDRWIAARFRPAERIGRYELWTR